jgi:hypothetical protein
MPACESLEIIASTQFYGVPNVVIYMTKSTLQKWKRINDFAYTMLDTVLSVLDGLEEPAEFVSALRKLPPNIPGTRADSGNGDSSREIGFIHISLPCIVT